jgi:NADH dehydrogenase
MTRRVLVLGGTGFVGRALAACLARPAGPGPQVTLRVPTRRLAQGRALLPLPGVALVQASVHDDAALAALLQGVDAVVNLVAILHGREADFQRVHVALPQRLAAACRRAGVARLVHVSALGVAADAPSAYLRSKWQGEQVLGEAGLALSVLRPSVIFGAEDRFLNLFEQLQRLLPVLALGGAQARMQPVWVGDVAAALQRLLADPTTAGHTYEAAGPAIYTLADLVRVAGVRAGVARPLLPLPAPLAWAQALLLEQWPGGPLMSRDNLLSLQVPNVASGTLPGLAALGIAPRGVHGL